MEKSNVPARLQQAGLSRPSDIPEKVKLLAKAVVGVNSLLPYKLTADEVIEWAYSIDRLAPEIDVMAIAFVMDMFMVEELPFDKAKGIQNIFLSLKRIEKVDDGYRIKPTTRYTW